MACLRAGLLINNSLITEKKYFARTQTVQRLMSETSKTSQRAFLLAREYYCTSSRETILFPLTQLGSSVLSVPQGAKREQAHTAKGKPHNPPS